MDFKYSLPELFEMAFGVKNPVFMTDNTSAVEKPDVTFPTVELKAREVYTRMTWMGTPVVFPFTLKGGIYKKYNDRAELVDFPLADFEMPAATLIDFTRAKNIVKTSVLGGSGSVKELYGFDDWKIRIRGICLTDSARLTAKTAEEQKKELLNFDSVCGAVGVIGSLFLEKEIHQLALGEIAIRQLEGQPGVIPFEFSCESDQPLELIL